MRSQERGVALALVGKGDNILRQEFSLASGFAGHVEDLADVVERD